MTVLTYAIPHNTINCIKTAANIISQTHLSTKAILTFEYGWDPWALVQLTFCIHQRSLCKFEFQCCLTNFFLKFTASDSFLCLVIPHQDHFATITHFYTIFCLSIQICWCYRQRLLEFSEATAYYCLEKKSCPENFWKLPSKVTMVESFLILF